MITGIYINLDRALRRRARLEAELARVGLAGRYKRLRAFAEAEPYRGCWRSHIKAMEDAADIGGIVHIIEDDVIFSDRAVAFLRSADLEKLLETYDIVFLSMWVDPHPDRLLVYRSLLQSVPEGGLAVLDMRRVRLAAMDSYVVAPRSLRRVATLMKNRLGTPPLMPNDTFLGDLVKSGRITAATILPFVTCIDLETGSRSAIQTLEQEEQARFIRLRTAFFAEPHRQQSYPLNFVQP